MDQPSVELIVRLTARVSAATFAVAWLAIVTGGENIRERDGWAVVVTVALLFYMAVFIILRAWGDAAVGRSSSRSLRVTANVAVLAIAVVFLNSYLARACECRCTGCRPSVLPESWRSTSSGRAGRLFLA